MAGGMDMRKLRALSFWNVWLFCLMGGIVTGSLLANLLGRELLIQVGYFDALMQSSSQQPAQEQWHLFLYILRQRMIQAGLAVLVGITLWAAAGYCMIAFGVGFVQAVVISMFSMQKGYLGLFYYLVTVLPQGLCYLAVWIVLTEGVQEGLTSMKLRFWAVVIILVVTGSALECWMNPGFLKLF